MAAHLTLPRGKRYFRDRRDPIHYLLVTLAIVHGETSALKLVSGRAIGTLSRTHVRQGLHRVSRWDGRSAAKRQDRGVLAGLDGAGSDYAIVGAFGRRGQGRRSLST